MLHTGTDCTAQRRVAHRDWLHCTTTCCTQGLVTLHNVVLHWCTVALVAALHNDVLHTGTGYTTQRRVAHRDWLHCTTTCCTQGLAALHNDVLHTGTGYTAQRRVAHRDWLHSTTTCGTQGLVTVHNDVLHTGTDCTAQRRVAHRDWLHCTTSRLGVQTRPCCTQGLAWESFFGRWRIKV